MSNIIDFTTFGNLKQERINKTLLKRDIKLSEGYEQISSEELKAMIGVIGYKIDNSMSFKYYNDYNELHYNAYSMSYTDIKTKLSYAHYTQRDSNGENLDKLQKIRRNYFVFENNTIWDL